MGLYYYGLRGTNATYSVVFLNLIPIVTSLVAITLRYLLAQSYMKNHGYANVVNDLPMHASLVLNSGQRSWHFQAGLAR
jgi:hypothetical protein